MKSEKLRVDFGTDTRGIKTSSEQTQIMSKWPDIKVSLKKGELYLKHEVSKSLSGVCLLSWCWDQTWSTVFEECPHLWSEQKMFGSEVHILVFEWLWSPVWPVCDINCRCWLSLTVHTTKNKITKCAQTVSIHHWAQSFWNVLMCALWKQHQRLKNIH